MDRPTNENGCISAWPGRDGALVERVEFPAGLDLSYGVLRPDLLVGVMRDELDVEYVVRLEVR